MPDAAAFVFADIAGYTALTEAHGDEQAADLVAEFFNAVSKAVPLGLRIEDEPAGCVLGPASRRLSCLRGPPSRGIGRSALGIAECGCVP